MSVDPQLASLQQKSSQDAQNPPTQRSSAWHWSLAQQSCWSSQATQDPPTQIRDPSVQSAWLQQSSWWQSMQSPSTQRRPGWQSVSRQQ